AGAAAERLYQVAELLVRAQLVGRRAGDVEDLAAQREDRLGLAVARLLGRAAGRIALDQEDLGALGRLPRAVGELAGQAQLARGALARHVLLGAAARALLGARDHVLDQRVRRGRMIGQPVIEMVLDRGLDQALRVGHAEALLGLALELRVL